MEWLARFVASLPLEQISDALSSVTRWWTTLVADVPPDVLPLYAYVVFSVVVLILWVFVARIMPKPLGGISWVALFAVLLTPTTSLGETADIAPASIGVVYAVMMKQPALALQYLLPILQVFFVGLVIGFVWQLLKNAIERSIEKSQAAARAKAQEQALLQAQTDSLNQSETQPLS